MAVRIENGEAINFGTLAAETVITHGRVSVGNVVLVTRPLATNRTIAANGQAEFAIGDIDLLFPANEYENGGYQDLLELAFDGTNSFNIDAMTDATTVVATSGYSQQSSANWTTSTESD